MTTSDLINLLNDLTAHPAETEWIEFKTKRFGVSDEQFGEYISAMSNGATLANKPFGYFVWGVEDKTHAIKGTDFTFVRAKHGGNQDLELFLRLNLQPKINFEIFEFDYQGKHIVLVRIPAAKGQPLEFQKKAHVRIGSNKTELKNFPDLMRIIYNSQEDWSEKIIENASLNDLDPEAIAIARTKYKKRNENNNFYKQIDKWDDALFLDKANITIGGKITNTAILLLGKPESAHYISPAIAEMTWKLDTEEKSYQHFFTPFLLTTTKLMQRIRNIKLRFYPNTELLATTVDKYDSQSILEALHNCIAHQDYRLHSRITVTEKVDKLVFSNAGIFFEGNPYDYAFGDKTPSKYRNPFLVRAMVNIGMIDRLGYGIHSLCVSQMDRFFPMPDYDLSEYGMVKLTIYGQAIDENYSKAIIERGNLSLQEVILLDRVQKHLEISDEAAAELRAKKLIEGRKPKYFVGSSIAKATGQKAEYSKNKAFEKEKYFEWILKSIKEHGSMNRKDIDNLLWNILPAWMDDRQKKNRIKNLLSELRDLGKITNIGSFTKSEWVISV